jgi:hypothetical protein
VIGQTKEIKARREKLDKEIDAADQQRQDVLNQIKLLQEQKVKDAAAAKANQGASANGG